MILFHQKRKKVTNTQGTPWKHEPIVKQIKKKSIKRACQRTDSKLNIDNQIHKEMLCLYNAEICKARQNTNNVRVLFATGERLTNPPYQFAPELFSAEKCDEFASFFTGKIEKLRQNMQCQNSTLLIIKFLKKQKKSQLIQIFTEYSTN